MRDINANLILRCKNREPEAFQVLLSRHENFLYRLCYSYLGNKEDALDVVQEVFIKVFNNIAAFDERRDFQPWLKKIAVNSCLNYQRSKKRQECLSLDYSRENQWNPLETIASEDDVEGLVLNSCLQESIRKCVRQLPPGPQMVLTLHYLEDLPCQKIAELLGQPLGTVKNSLYRARGLLKKKLSEQGLLEA